MAVFSTNRKASFNYDIRETFEAGLSLLGWEVKSVKQSKVDLSGSYGIIRGGEVWLVNMDIRPYQPGNISEGTDTSRLRKLLLNKKEIVEMAKKIESDRLSLIPLELYEKGNRIKVKIGLGLPRNRSDKREAIKKKDISRELGKRIK